MIHSAKDYSLASRMPRRPRALRIERQPSPFQSQLAMTDKAEFVLCESTIWKRFWRLSRAGVIEAFFEALASLSPSAHLVQMFDSRVVRAHVSAAGAKGGRPAKRWAAHVVGSR